jgi:hypothetical protein
MGITWIPPEKFGDCQKLLRVSELAEITGFSISRFFEIRGDEELVGGNHGHYSCHQIFNCPAGKIELTVTRLGEKEEKYTLDPESWLLWVPPNHFLTYKFLEPHSIIQVFASHSYDASDYFFRI